MDHEQIITLAIAYTLAGALIFTVIITTLSLVGWVRFADAKQQQKLFKVLIIELVVIGLGVFGNFLEFNASSVQDAIKGDTIIALQKSGLLQHTDQSRKSGSGNISIEKDDGIKAYWLSIDNEKVDFVNDQSSVFLPPGEHVLTWFMAGNPGSKLAIEISQNNQPLANVVSTIPSSEDQGAGVRRFEVPTNN